MAEEMLTDYVKHYPNFFGSNNVSYNIHNLLHISDCARQFGHIDEFSAYKYENCMQFLSKKK